MELTPQYRYEFKRINNTYDIWDCLEKVYLSAVGKVKAVPCNEDDVFENLDKKIADKRDDLIYQCQILNSEYDKYIYDISKLLRIDFT